MKTFTMILTVAAAIVLFGGTSYANSAQYAPPTASAPDKIEVINNAEGVASYAPPTADEMAAKMQDITPAAGDGLSNEQLENWELHRLQRFYNGEDGVTK